MGKIILPYYETPDVPWCVLGKVSWGVVQAVKLPEHLAPYYVQKHGWSVLIRDSEFPVPIDDYGTMPEITNWQRNPARRAHPYRHSADYHEDGA